MFSPRNSILIHSINQNYSSHITENYWLLVEHEPIKQANEPKIAIIIRIMMIQNNAIIPALKFL